MNNTLSKHKDNFNMKDFEIGIDNDFIKSQDQVITAITSNGGNDDEDIDEYERIIKMNKWKMENEKVRLEKQAKAMIYLKIMKEKMMYEDYQKKLEFLAFLLFS